MRIEVTQEDIDAGQRGAGNSCPIALAIKRTLKREHGVFVDTLYIDVAPCSHVTPLEAGDFITDFDGGSTVKPFSFELK